MKLLVKLTALAALALGLSGFGAQAGSREGLTVQVGSYSKCFDDGYHRCGPPLLYRPGHPGYRYGPRVGFELQFGNVHPRAYYRPQPLIRHVRFCSNDMAVDKARALGIRSIRAYAYPDYVLIRGHKRGHRVEVAMARAHGCPVIQY